PDFEQAGDAALYSDSTLGWFGNAAEDFQKSTFAGAVAADDAEDFAAADFEGDIFESPEELGGRRSEVGRRRTNGRRSEVGDRRTNGRRSEVGGRKAAAERPETARDRSRVIGKYI